MCDENGSEIVSALFVSASAAENIDIKVVSKHSRLKHTKGIEQRVRKALVARYLNPDADGGAAVVAASQQSPMLEGTMTTLYVQLFQDSCQVSVETATSGDDRLHNRGYRRHIGRAPIRESLAAACYKVCLKV